MLGGIFLMIGCSQVPNSRGSAKEALTKGTPFNERFFNPVKDDNMLGDPWIIQHEGWYYYTQSGGHHIVVTRSDTITGVSAGQSREIWNIASQRGLDQVWAPELHFYDGLWYCYFTARQNNADTLRRIFVLRSRSADPMGEWDFIGKIPLPDDQWAIDATLLTHEGRLFLLWSGWKDISEGPGVWRQNIYISELADPVTIKPGVPRVKISGPEYSWETVDLPQNEGPQILKSPNGRVFCIYSASFSRGNSYCLGLVELTGEAMNAADWIKSSTPVFQSAPEVRVYSPGHCSFTESPDKSEHWIVYHAAKDSRTGWDRSARIQRFGFDEKGFPVFGTPNSTNVAFSVPSGESVNRVLYRAEDAELIEANVQAADGAETNVVTLPELDSSVTFRLTVPSAGSYPVYIRYTNSMPMTSQATLRINGERRITVQFRRCAMSGAASSDMGLTVIRVELQAGLNTLAFSGTRAVGLDCIILDLGR
jgi:GH43 family beta-xylosidase